VKEISPLNSIDNHVTRSKPEWLCAGVIAGCCK
jgi:hypothetical protein